MTALSHSTPYWRDMQCSAILGYTLQPNDVIVESLDRDAEPMLVVENTLSRSKMHYNQYSVTYHNGQCGKYYDMPPELWESDDEQDPSKQPNCQQFGCAELPPHGHWLVENGESESYWKREHVYRIHMDQTSETLSVLASYPIIVAAFTL